MGIYRPKPTPRQELIGRLATIVGGALIGLVAIALGCFCIRLIRGLGEVESGFAAARFCWPLLAVAVFLALLSIAIIIMAILDRPESRDGPPRGFGFFSGLFDLFGAIINEITRSRW